LSEKQIGLEKDVSKGVLIFKASEYVAGAILDIDEGQKLV